MEVGYGHGVFVRGGVVEAFACLGVLHCVSVIVRARGLGGKGYLCVVLAYATVFVSGDYVAA